MLTSEKEKQFSKGRAYWTRKITKHTVRGIRKATKSILLIKEIIKRVVYK